ncbi:MAG: cardiolipin synthase [Lachnospiraceae bacterium]|nr:cardiolipin synthase [Lachnospiraceae bacterium]
MDIVWQNVQTGFDFVFSHLMIINLILAVIIVFFQRKEPKSVWAWLLILYFIPVAGFIFYLLIGTDMHKQKMFRTKEIEDKLSDAIRHQETSIRNQELSVSYPEMKDYGDLVMYHLHASNAILTDDNEVQFFVDGRAKFGALAEDLKRAEKSIHIQYYIIKDDEVFRAILEVLEQKVKEGVEVRILFDGMGGRFVKGSVWKRLRGMGIQVAEFFPAALGQLHLRINYRNHRKIVVIDGKTGYVGGFNIAREYVGLDPKFGYWRDTHMRITGSAVDALQVRFILDWNFAARNSTIAFDRYLTAPEKMSKGGCPVQIVTSGPDSLEQSIRNTYLRLIHKAKRSIYIQTPYFIPDEAIMSALVIAVHSGVEVNIMIPCKPDHPFVYWATYSYVGELVLLGANCFLYMDGFLHAKGIVVDEMVLSYGTANMDIRSFALNFEVNAILYDEDKAKEMTEYFREDLKKSKQITKNMYLGRNLLVRFKEQVSRLLSPLL